MTDRIQASLKLRSGYEMPVLGLGTWQLTGKSCEDTVRQAVDMGYRHIDTAELYENEAEIGRALQGIERDRLFITSKAASRHAAKEEVLKACDRSLAKLKTDYLDLYLLHWPNDEVPIEQTLEAMQILLEGQKIHSAGVSNFDVGRLEQAVSAGVVSVCNLQIEYHPFTPRAALPEFCRNENITITAYSPLARGKVFQDETLTAIARKYHKSAGQISLRWLVQNGHCVIPKSSSKEHLAENMRIFDWELAEEDMERIENIQYSQRLVDTKYT